MKIKMKNIILGVTLALSTGFVFGQIDRSKVPVPGPAPEIHIANPVVFDLDNGMKVILSSNHKIPKVSFNLVMGSDPRIEGDKAGLSEMLGSLLLSGTTNRSKDELDEEKDFIGASIFAGSSSIYLSVLTKHLNKGLDIMTDVMQNANFPKSEFERIQKQYESELYSMKVDPNAMASNAVSKVIFTNDHPYGEVMTEETLANISRQDVIDFYKEQYTPAGSYLVIVGDIDEATARKIATDRFGSWEGGIPFNKDYSVAPSTDGNRVIFVDKPGAVQSVISVAFPIDMAPGNEDQIKLSVLNSIMGGHNFGARLMQNLREDKAYTYGAYSSMKVNREGSYIAATGSFRNEVTDSAIVQFIYEIDRITNDLVTDEEIASTKAAMAGSFARSLESSRTVANFALNIFRNDLPADYYQTYLKKLEAVTKEDVLEMAKKYFDANKLDIVVVGSKEDVFENLKALDADGTIEVLDAFGDPATDKEFKEATLTSEEVLQNYLVAITQTNNFKEAEDKIDKINTLILKSEIQINNSPMKMNVVKQFKAPNLSNEKMEFNGMTVSETIFTGDAGVTKMMNQMGKLDTKVMTEQEIADKRKTAAVFPEFSMVCCHKDDLVLLGIEEKADGRSTYVIEYKTEDSKVTAYFDTKTFLKIQTDQLEVTEEGPQSISMIYSDYTDYNGYLFPKTTAQMVESMSMTGKITDIEINGKVDAKAFKID